MDSSRIMTKKSAVIIIILIIIGFTSSILDAANKKETVIFNNLGKTNSIKTMSIDMSLLAPSANSANKQAV